MRGTLKKWRSSEMAGKKNATCNNKGCRDVACHVRRNLLKISYLMITILNLNLF